MVKNLPKAGKLSASARYESVFEAVSGKKSVSWVCKKYGISRSFFYKLKSKYLQAGDSKREKLKSLKPNHKCQRGGKKLSEDQVGEILSVIFKNPEYGIKKALQQIYAKRHKQIVSHGGIQSFLLKLNLRTKRQRKLFIKWARRLSREKVVDLVCLSLARYKRKEPLLPEERLKVVKLVDEGAPIVQACTLFRITRRNFYKWQRRYHQSASGREYQAVTDKKPVIERYWRQVTEGQVEAIVKIVVEHPDYSTHKIAEILKWIGNHGVQNVFRRLNLNTYEKRLAYAREKGPVVTPVFGLLNRVVKLIGRIPVISAIPPPAREKIASLKAPFVLACTSSAVASSLFVFWLGIMSSAPTLNSQIGLFFASVALLMGSFFFIYSMKYYLTLGLVLSFSRQPIEEGGGLTVSLNGRVKHDNGFENGNGNGGGWLRRIFGLNGNGHSTDSAGASTELSRTSSPQAGSGLSNGGKGVVLAGGLQPSLDHINLERYPFVSIHLPLYNERKVVERLLDACTSMDYKNYEIIVCDDSTDETTEIVQRYAKEHNLKNPNGPRIKVLHRETREGFKGGALREALKQMDSRTEFVVVFDADFVPYPDTLELFVKNFKVNNPSTSSGQDYSEDYKKSNLAVVGGYQWHVLNKSENWITRGVRTEYSGSYVVERPGTEILGLLKQISGSVYMIRADLLKKFGWGTSITEDFELTLKLYEQGYKVVYTPYVQAPAECVSTLKRLIRQRMRWAEGHSNNIKKMFKRIMSSSKMTFKEKLEFLYLSPYYLQATFFLVGTVCWLLAETVFRAKLPFWTSLWGWSLVLTNFFSLPLMNSAGLFLEESEERDYVGILSFVVLSYILVPFQAYASVKGFLEKQEGPWFRTPKTGLITDIFTRGKFYRWISGILPGWRGPSFAKAMAASIKEGLPAAAYSRFGNYAPLAGEAGLRGKNNPYLALATANNRFDSFSIRPRKRKRWVRAILAILLSVTTTLVYLSRGVEVVYATNMTGPMKLGIGAPSGEDPWPTGGNWLQNAASFGTGSLFYFAVVGTSFRWYTQLLPTGGWDAMVPKGAYSVNIAKTTGPAVGNIINYSVQLLLTNSAGGLPSQLLGAAFSMNNTNADNTIFNLPLGTLGSNQTITAADKKRLAVNIYITSQNHPTRPKYNWVINNGTVPAQLMIPANIVVPEIPRKTVFVILIGIMPAIPVLMKLRLERRKRQKRKGEKGWTQEFNEFLDKLTGRKEVVLDELPV